MEDFEQQIRNALARKEPSPLFEARVLEARVLAAKDIRRSPWQRFFLAGRLRWASALAAGLLVITGVTWQHERAVQERAAGEAAKARLKLALKITSMKLSKIQQKVEAAQENN